MESRALAGGGGRVASGPAPGRSPVSSKASSLTGLQQGSLQDLLALPGFLLLWQVTTFTQACDV